MQMLDTPVETCFHFIEKIGQGSFGTVIKARDKRTKQIVAIKKIISYSEYQANIVRRERKILESLDHKNIIKLLDFHQACFDIDGRKTQKVHLIFRFCEYDLGGLLMNPKVHFTIGHIRDLMHQLLNGLFHVQKLKFMHRDLKPENILITKEGTLKISDFGLARSFETKPDDVTNCFTTQVVTLWFRAPEILLGDRNYGPSSDMWSFGCIIAQMFTRAALFQGASEIQQLHHISHLCGSINPSVWQDVVDLEVYKTFALPQTHKRKLKRALESFVKDRDALELIDDILVLDPAKRLNATSAYKSDFFWPKENRTNIAIMLAQHEKSMLYYNSCRQPAIVLPEKPQRKTMKDLLLKKQ